MLVSWKASTDYSIRLVGLDHLALWTMMSLSSFKTFARFISSWTLIDSCEVKAHLTNFTLVYNTTTKGAIFN
ncbi:hypothetical protein EUGRSUZ_J01433 [Eucalyptus grandis]|uniref:Uncharacterized protein n=2 Tax=Eucalyptus grandis TaxID=71139 RepID=A0ACC3J5B8_EUCGR|nr:hypothetical protein EUGRSUZ_J01433 [Eucalyptus grandis]